MAVYVVTFDWEMRGEESGLETTLYSNWIDAYNRFNQYIEKEKHESWWNEIPSDIELDDGGFYDDEDYGIDYFVDPAIEAHLYVTDYMKGSYTNISICKKEVQ